MYSGKPRKPGSLNSRKKRKKRTHINAFEEANAAHECITAKCLGGGARG